MRIVRRHIFHLIVFVRLAISFPALAAESVLECYPVVDKESATLQFRLEGEKENLFAFSPRRMWCRWPREPYLFRRPSVTLDPKIKYTFTLERTNLSQSDDGAELLKIEKDGKTIFDGWICEIHRSKMELKDVKVIYGLAIPILHHGLSPEQMSRMRMAKFPHANEVVLGGCIVESQISAPKLVCAECKKAFTEWVALDKATANKQIPPLDVRLPYEK